MYGTWHRKVTTRFSSPHSVRHLISECLSWPPEHAVNNQPHSHAVLVYTIRLQVVVHFGPQIAVRHCIALALSGKMVMQVSFICFHA